MAAGPQAHCVKTERLCCDNTGSQQRHTTDIYFSSHKLPVQSHGPNLTARRSGRHKQASGIYEEHKILLRQGPVAASMRVAIYLFTCTQCFQGIFYMKKVLWLKKKMFEGTNSMIKMTMSNLRSPDFGILLKI